MKSVCGAGQDAAAVGERLLAVGRERARQLQQRLAEALAEEAAVGLREQRLLDLAGARRARSRANGSSQMSKRSWTWEMLEPIA